MVSHAIEVRNLYKIFGPRGGDYVDAVKNGLEAVTLSENLTQFTDASDISAWAVSAMQWAVGQGPIQGSNGQLRPQANASRAEVATILMRFCELMKK